MLRGFLVRFLSTSETHYSTRIYEAAVNSIQSKNYTLMAKLEPQILEKLHEFEVNQLSNLWISFKKCRVGSPLLLEHLRDAMNTKISKLDGQQFTWTMMNLLETIDPNDGNWVKYSEMIKQADLSVSQSVSILKLCGKYQSNPKDLVSALVQHTMTKVDGCTSGEMISVIMLSLNKLKWGNQADFERLIRAYGRIDAPPTHQEYMSAIVGAGELIAMDRGFVNKVRKYLNAFLNESNIISLCNVCHAASLQPKIYTDEMWEQLYSKCFSFKDAILRSPLNLSTVLHAYSKTQHSSQPWLEGLTEEHVKSWNPTQLSIISFSIRRYIRQFPELKEWIKKETIVKLPSMSGKHKLNTLLLWSEGEMFDESYWMHLDPYLDIIMQELKSTRWNSHASNQIRTICVRISKYKNEHFIPKRYN